MKRICTECGLLFEPKPLTARRHPACERAFSLRREKRRGSTAERGLAGEHARISRGYKERDEPCRRCGRHGTPDNPITAHHVVSRAHGGTSTEENYVPLCRSCNSSLGSGTV